MYTFMSRMFQGPKEMVLLTRIKFSGVMKCPKMYIKDRGSLKEIPHFQLKVIFKKKQTLP